jgi:hypothetical protein
MDPPHPTYGGGSFASQNADRVLRTDLFVAKLFGAGEQALRAAGFGREANRETLAMKLRALEVARAARQRCHYAGADRAPREKGNAREPEPSRCGIDDGKQAQMARWIAERKRKAA